VNTNKCSNKNEHHILALSGGKDSAALAVYMKEKYPELQMEYVFTDSGCELPETYEYLNRIRAVLNVNINVLKSRRNFDYWLKYFKGVLPSPQNRWCTRLLKLEPFEAYVGDKTVYSYVALRADEKREGYKPTIPNIIPRHPFIEDGIILSDVENILRTSGLGMPGYYLWRKRSGCFFCFYQNEKDWVGLRKHHPDLFKKACQYEENHRDCRIYTWRTGEKGKPKYLKDLKDDDKFLDNIPSDLHEKKKLIDILCSDNLRGALRYEGSTKSKGVKPNE
jgi:3'-phosphoadenosine 5'-phosphosulfate sulfotransferase (PAPS reductase)/FAD synthetase